jgi:hypothetical protein
LLSPILPKVLVQGGENGASPALLDVERIQSTENFPKSSALDPNARRMLERKSPVVHPWDIKEFLDELHCKGYYP